MKDIEIIEKAITICKSHDKCVYCELYEACFYGSKVSIASVRELVPRLSGFIKPELSIKIKYLKNIEPIKQIEQGDWIDLRTGEDINIKGNTFTMIPLGVAIELPAGYEALLLPRSSTFKKYSIIQTNSIGVIDESYCGNNDEWKMPVYAVADTFIPKNTRIAQFRILKHQPGVRIIEVANLKNNDRGGFGSTGEA